MKARFTAAAAALLVSSGSYAYPITYVMSGTINYGNYGGLNGTRTQPGDVPVVIDGNVVMNGNPLALGQLTFDSEAAKYLKPDAYPDDIRPLAQAAWETIGYSMFASGYFTSWDMNPHTPFHQWSYTESGISIYWEGPASYGPFRRGRLNLQFQPTGEPHGNVDYLSVQNFIGGTFSLTDAPGCGTSPTICGLYGTIDSLTRVTPPPASVPEPSTLGALTAGLLAMVGIGRRRLRANVK